MHYFIFKIPSKSYHNYKWEQARQLELFLVWFLECASQSIFPSFPLLTGRSDVCVTGKIICKSHDPFVEAIKIISYKLPLLISKLDYRLSLSYVMIKYQRKMYLTECFVTFTTEQFSCTNDRRFRKREEIRRGCRVYCRSGSTKAATMPQLEFV